MIRWRCHGVLQRTSLHIMQNKLPWHYNYILPVHLTQNRDVATGLVAEKLRFYSWQIFPLCPYQIRHSPTHLSNDYGDSFSESKVASAWNWPFTINWCQNTRSYTYVPPHIFVAWQLTKPGSNFTFTSKRQRIKQVHIIFSLLHRACCRVYSINTPTNALT